MAANEAHHHPRLLSEMGSATKKLKKMKIAEAKMKKKEKKLKKRESKMKREIKNKEKKMKKQAGL